MHYVAKEIGTADLYTIIPMDNAKYVEQLSFIFMYSLDLYIEHCIWADLQK